MTPDSQKDKPEEGETNYKSKIHSWADEYLGGLEKYWIDQQVPNIIRPALHEVVIERSKYAKTIQGIAEAEFQKKAIEIYKKHNVPLSLIQPAHIMVLDIVKMWRDHTTRHN